MTMLSDGIEEVTSIVWGSVLDLPVELAIGQLLPTNPTVTCFVQIEGAWEGAVVFRCPERLGILLADSMFGDSSANRDTSDIRDALGEITNILTGNIKALLPQPSRITLPVIASGNDYELEVLGTETMAEVAFSCLGETFVVTMLHQADAN